METRQRKRSKETTTTSSSDETTFARHTQEDTAITQQADDDTENNTTPGLTWLGRLAIFLVFPLLVGLLGLYMAFLETKKSPDRHLSFDQDFVLPFLLALAMAIVVGFQTGGFTSRKVKPLIAWPKVKRVKKIVHKRKDKADYSSAKKDQ